MPRAPEPAQRSMTRRPSSSASGTLKTASLTTHGLGRTPLGVSNRRPPSSPPWILRLPVNGAAGSGADANASSSRHPTDLDRLRAGGPEGRRRLRRKSHQETAAGLGVAEQQLLVLGQRTPVHQGRERGVVAPA